MRFSKFRTLVFGMVLLAGISARALADDVNRPVLQDRLDAMRDEMATTLHDFQIKQDKPQANPSTRFYTFAARYALALGMDPKIAEDLILRAMGRQDMNPASPGFGDIPWEMFKNDVKDANSVEFTFTSIGPILLGYSDKLSPEFRQKMSPHIAAGIIAIRRHKVDVRYTNIFLMKTVNLLLLGQATGDDKAVADAHALLDTWLQFTRANGVHEFASPTYAMVQLYSLLDGYRYTNDADVKSTLGHILDYEWADAAASCFAPGDTMAGAHSRDYDFLRGTGPIDRFYWVEGLFNDLPKKPVLLCDGYEAYLNFLDSGYRPPNRILDLSRVSERIIKAKFDNGPGRDRYTYITPDFAVGSTSAYYGAQNREIAVDLGDARAHKPVSISVSADTYDSPYGKYELLDRSGHLKPVRLRTDIASVQDHGTVLTLLNLAPDLSKNAATSVATDVVIPLTADRIVLDGQPIQWPAEALSEADSEKLKAPADSLRTWSLPASRDGVLGIRYGKAGVAIRIFAADGLGGQEAQFALKCDGAPYDAARLIVYHYQGEAKNWKEKHVRAGLLILCDQCDSDADLDSLMQRAKAADIQQNLAEEKWDVETKIAEDSGNTTLQTTLDLASGHPLVRRVNGADYVVDRFTMNGRDLSAEFLGN